MNNNGRDGRKKSDDEGDRISELPESVLHLILSYLDLKLAVQTSILSTKWRYVWKSLPFLNFDEDRFHKTSTKGPDSSSSIPKFGDFVDYDLWFGDLGFGDFVDNVLNHRDSSSSIQRFRLSCYKGIYEQSYFDKRLLRWIVTAVESNVEDMYIDVDTQILLPRCLLNCKSLRKLEVISLDYAFVGLPDSMNLPGLKTLILYGAQFDYRDDDIPNKIISSCPALESLEFESCRFYQPTVDIYAPQLKHLVFRDCDHLDFYDDEIDLNQYVVKLNAPNLISFRCDDNMSKDYCLVNLSSLVKAEIYMVVRLYDDDDGNSIFDDETRQVFVQRMFKILSALHNVEDLTLSDWFIEVVTGGLALLRNPSIQFWNLRCLKLEIWTYSGDCFNAIAHLLNISPNIESLFLGIKEVRFDVAKTEGDWEVITLHHLKFVKIYGVQGCLNELKFLKFLLKNGMVLEKVIVEPPYREELSREFVQQLLTLPRASSSIDFSIP